MTFAGLRLKKIKDEFTYTTHKISQFKLKIYFEREFAIQNNDMFNQITNFQ